MFWIFRLFSWTIAFSLPLSGAQAKDLLFYVGEKKLFPLPRDAVAHVGDPKILSVNQEEDRLVLRARRKGVSWLALDGASRRVIVLEKPALQKARLLQGLLANMWGLRLVFRPEPEVQGRLNSFEDWLALAQFSRRAGARYLFKARLGEGIEEEAAAFFQTVLLRGRPLPEISLRSLPFLPVPRGSDLSFYERALQPFGLKPAEEPTWTAVRSFIKIELALAETGLSSSLSLGALPGLFAAEGEPFSFPSLLKFLELLKARGGGRVLQRSLLLAQSGQTLHIHSGGQIPFRQYNFQTRQESSQWKSYGMTLSLTPKIDSRRNILLEIKAEFSEPAAAISGKRAPPLKSQRMETSFKLKSGQIVKALQIEKTGRRKGGAGGFFAAPPFIDSLVGRSHDFQSRQMILLRPEILTGPL